MANVAPKKKEHRALSQVDGATLIRLAEFSEKQNSHDGENYIIDVYVLREHYTPERYEQVKKELQSMIEDIEEYKWNQSAKGNIGILKATGRWFMERYKGWVDETAPQLEGIELESIIIKIQEDTYIVHRTDKKGNISPSLRNRIQQTMIERDFPKDENGKRNFNELFSVCKEFGENFDSCIIKSEPGYVVYKNLEKKLQEICPPIFRE